MIKQLVGANPDLLIRIEKMIVGRETMHLVIMMDLFGTKEGGQIRRLVKVETNGTAQNPHLGMHRTLVLVVQTRIPVGVKNVIRLKVGTRILVGAKVIGKLDLVMQTRIPVGVKNVIRLKVRTRILVGAKVIGKLDLMMQTRILIGARKEIGSLEMKIKVRVLVIGQVVGILREILEAEAVQIEEALEVEGVLEAETGGGLVVDQTQEDLEEETVGVLVVEVEVGRTEEVLVVDQTQEDLGIEAVEGGTKAVVGTTEITLVRISPLTGKIMMVQELGTMEEVVITRSGRAGVQEVVELAINPVVGASQQRVKMLLLVMLYLVGGTKEPVQLMMLEEARETIGVQLMKLVEVRETIGDQMLLVGASGLARTSRPSPRKLKKLKMQRVQFGTEEQVQVLQMGVSHLVGINQKMQKEELTGMENQLIRGEKQQEALGGKRMTRVAKEGGKYFALTYVELLMPTCRYCFSARV
jgi:hypothetical protein